MLPTAFTDRFTVRRASRENAFFPASLSGAAGQRVDRQKAAARPTAKQDCGLLSHGAGCCVAKGSLGGGWEGGRPAKERGVELSRVHVQPDRAADPFPPLPTYSVSADSVLPGAAAVSYV